MNITNSVNNRLNAFQNYGQFLQKNVDRTQPKNLALVFYQQDQFANDMCTPSDIDKILKSKFYKSSYPSDLLAVNCFCPICGKLVKCQQQNSIYQSQRYNRKFLAHDKCLLQQTSTYLNDYFDQVQQMQIKNSEQMLLSTTMDPLSVDERQFCLQLSLTHPLSNFKFTKFFTKSNLKNNSINWKFGREDQQFCYLPNIICFPFVDFKIILTISQIGSQQSKKNFTNYINLSRAKLTNTNSIAVKSQNIVVFFKIYNTQQEKQNIITKMNYKYQYSQQKSLPMVQLISLKVQVPEQQDYDQQIQSSNNTIVQLLSQKIQQSSSYNSSLYLYSNPNNKYGNYDESISTNGNQMNYYGQNAQKMDNDKCVIAQKEKIDFQKLISTGKLSSYVRNSTQSRMFQNFLDEAHVQQIQIIINTLYQQFPELVIDQYANYMTQKLFQVCSASQRIMILKKLCPSLPNLVRNKQGTHTIQFFTQKLKLNQEYELIMDSIRQQFVQLCQHSISTHFIQKIIKIFPLQITLKFYYIADKHFLKFATDKNAMCVLKYMLKGIKAHENNEKTIEIKKHFINSITLNTDKIIQDCYGNYVVQFCYELFGQTKSSGITEMIIQKFVQFSLQKYSSSVISKCISVYWTDKSYVNKLKQTLKNDGILQMYRNRQGNKILLQLMDKNQNTALREKIYSLLANHGEPSKFYHERWGLQIGIRSGPVGIQFKSFTDADTQHRNHNNTVSKKSKKK